MGRARIELLAALIALSLPLQAVAQQCTLIFDDGQRVEHVPQVKSAADQQRGLSKRNDVGNGMLFSWPSSAPRQFWMRDTMVPLSVAFMDDAGLIFQIDAMAAESDTIHPSALPARDALEVRQGSFEQLHIRIGSRLVKRSCQPS